MNPSDEGAPLPRGWRLAKIGDLFESWGGMTPSKANTAFWGDGIPWVSSKDVKSPRLTTTTHSITSAAVAATGLRICPPGSVLVVVRSGVLAHSLPVTVTDFPVTINQDLKAFYSAQPYLNDWLALFLRMSAHSLLASSRRDGTTVQSVQYPLLKDTLMPIPPEEGRSQLVDAVHTALDRQQSVQPRLSAAWRAIDRFRRSVLAAACSGRLSASPGDMSPASSWGTLTLGEMATRITKGTTPTSYGHTFQTSGVTFVKVENLRDGRIDHGSIRSFISESTDRAQSRSTLREGDVLFSIAGTIGRAAVVTGEDLPANTNQALAVISGTDRFVTPEYLSIALQSAVQRSATELARGSGMNNISLADVRGFRISIPPRHQQEAIVQRVNQLFQVAAETVKHVDAASKAIDRTSHAILVKAFRNDLLLTAEEFMTTVAAGVE